MLIGYFSDAPDGFLVGAHAACRYRAVDFPLAHRPGFLAPPVAARKLATLDQLIEAPAFPEILTLPAYDRITADVA